MSQPVRNLLQNPPSEQATFYVRPNGGGGRAINVRPVTRDSPSGGIFQTTPPVNAGVPYIFGNALQQQAQALLGLPKFDGQAKSWPKFLRDWHEYLATADKDNLSSDSDKALIFKNHLPTNLRQEMEAFMNEGNTFPQWLNRLKVRFGNPAEMERKQWRELRMYYKGKLSIEDWCSFMAQFSYFKRKANASDDEAMTVLFNAVPDFVQRWLKQQKITKAYRGKHVHVTLADDMPPRVVCDILPKWTNGVRLKNAEPLGNGVF